MTRVLITGATTPIGVCTIEQLLARDDTERILAVGVEPDAAATPLPRDERLRYVSVDISRQRRTRRLLYGPVREERLEVVLHLALHRSAFMRGRAAYNLNVEGTRCLLSLAERHSTLRRFVFRSFGEVFDVRADRPVLIGEEHPLNLSPRAPQWVRDRVEADLAVATRMGMSELQIMVLRCAECLAPNTGSQLYDYLGSRVCFTPAGFDPMINVISLRDLADALSRAVRSDAEGIITVPGADTLPMSELIRKWGRRGVPVPGPLMAPLYRARAATTGTDFRYDLNQWRFHFSGVLDGRRAQEVLGYTPRVPICWPVA